MHRFYTERKSTHLVRHLEPLVLILKNIKQVLQGHLYLVLYIQNITSHLKLQPYYLIIAETSSFVSKYANQHNSLCIAVHSKIDGFCRLTILMQIIPLSLEKKQDWQHSTNSTATPLDIINGLSIHLAVISATHVLHYPHSFQRGCASLLSVALLYI